MKVSVLMWMKKLLPLVIELAVILSPSTICCYMAIPFLSILEKLPPIV